MIPLPDERGEGIGRSERVRAAGSRISPAYARVEELIRADRCVVLDGGIGTELPRAAGAPALDERLWGIGSLVDAPAAVLAVHRDYVAAGCDVLTTHTWGLPTALADADSRLWELTRSVHWVDVARRGLRLARRAAGADCAVAFSLNGDVDSPGGGETIQLLSRLFAEDPPDVILVETLALVRDSLYATVEALLATGLPVWLSFRRCRHGLCGVYGQHWGGPEGDAFGRAALRLEQLGVRRAADQLHPARPRRRHGPVPARLHRPAARRLSQPRLLHERRLAARRASAGRSTRGSPAAGASRARS